MRSGLSIAPTVQAIVVNRVPVVDPQFAPIIGDDAKMVMTCPENSQAACPSDSEVIASGEARPSATCVAIVHNVFPASHVWSAALQVLATAALAKIVSVLPEETMAISGLVIITSATCASDNPPVSSIGTMVPEEHPSMTTTLKHLKSHKMPSCTKMPSGVASAPSVQTIVVNCVSIVNPQLASIIGNNLQVVMAGSEDSHAACPTYSEVIAFSKARPPATCVSVVHKVSPTSHIWSATVQVLAPTTLTKKEGIFHEETVAICGFIFDRASSTCANNSPSVSSIRAMVPEEHTSMTTSLKHLKSH
jgi:hypothetical protein